MIYSAASIAVCRSKLRFSSFSGDTTTNQRRVLRILLLSLPSSLSRRAWTLYAILRTNWPSRPDNAEEILDEPVENVFNGNTKQPYNKREEDDPEDGSLTMLFVQTTGQ